VIATKTTSESPLTREQAAAEFTRQMGDLYEEYRAGYEPCRAYARRVQVKLEKIAPDHTDAHAEFLAGICSNFDDQYGLGTQLCLEWFVDHYVAREFERAYPWLREIWQFLIDGGHDHRNKLEYFKDAEAFFVDKTRLVCVFGTQYHRDPRYLVIYNEHGHVLKYPHRECYVRHIWRKTKFDCIGSVVQPTLKHYRDVGFELRYHDGPLRIYGDCRDEGHIFTYKSDFGKAKCDHAMWHLNEALRFFFEVNTLWTQTVGETKRSQGTT
jgi:hypothetical protein